MTHCPSCGSPLPEPPDRFCPTCGADLQAAYPPPVPGAAGGERPLPPTTSAQPPGGGTPWERRGQIGFGTALVETTQRVMTSPTAFFRSMPVTGGIGGPLLYAVIVGWIGLVATALYDAILRSMLGPTLPAWARGDMERLMPMLAGWAGLIVQAIFGPVIVTIGLFIFAAIVHLMLLLVGGARRGFEATFRTGAYSEAAMLLGIIPFCGGIISAVYFLVLAILGLAEAHGISRGRSAAAVLLPLVLVCCCGALAAIIVAGGIMAALERAR